MSPVSDSRQLPAGTQVAGYQTWRQLAFLHWRVPAPEIQRALPAALTVEEYDNTAWLGVVPFSMEKIRPWWSPPVPGISWFLETNVRTYVRHPDGTSGVWFFSLEANSRLAVLAARTFWHLPYFSGRMTLQRRAVPGLTVDAAVQRCSYTGQRSGQPSCHYRMEVEVPENAVDSVASPGTLSHFLLERYMLFAEGPHGQLFQGEVHHQPYRFRPAKVVHCEQTLCSHAGFAACNDTAPDHVTFSPGVDVAVSSLRPIG